MDMFSFLAIWFNNLRKNTFKVEVTNQSKFPDLNRLFSSLEEVNVSLKSLPLNSSNELSKVLKSNSASYSELVSSLSSLASELKSFPSSQAQSLKEQTESLLKILAKPELSKVEVINQPKFPDFKFPKEMQVSGEVEVKNFPKLQKIEGKVDVDFKSVVKGLQVVVDAINELKLELGTLQTGGGIAGTTGSHKSSASDIVRVASNSALQRTFANVAANSTASTLVSAAAGKKVIVLQAFALAGSTATNLTFNSNSTAISPTMSNTSNAGEVLPFSQMGWFETSTGEALTVTTGAGSTTGILIGYIQV